MHAHIGPPEAVLDVRTVRVSGWRGDMRLPMIAEKTPVTRGVRAGTEIRTTAGIR